MEPAQTSCPYCNALVPISGAEGKIACPRCGESFQPPRTSAEVQPATETPAPAAPAAPVNAETQASDSPPRPATGLSNRAIGFLVLGVMVSMAAGGLILALSTVPDRIANHQGIIKPESTSVPLFLKFIGLAWILGLVYLLHGIWKRIRITEAASWYRWVIGVLVVQAVLAGLFVTLWSRNRGSQPRAPISLELEDVARRAVKPVAPLELTGLAYLPPGCNMVGGVRAASFKPEEFDAIVGSFWPGARAFSAQDIEAWTGLHWESIDHVVVGAKIGVELPPPAVLVARTLRPVDPDKVVAALKARPLADANRYRFKIDNPAFEAVLWCLPDRQTFLVALSEQDFTGIEVPAAGASLPDSLRDLMKERLGQHAWAWLVVHNEGWPLLDQLTGDDRISIPGLADLKQVTDAGVWLAPVVEPRLHAAIDCKDEAAASRLEKLARDSLGKRLPDLKLLRKQDWLLLEAEPPRPK